MQPVPYSVDFHGRPVDSVTVTIDLTDQGSRADSSDGTVTTPTIAVRRDQVRTETMRATKTYAPQYHLAIRHMSFCLITMR